MFDQTIKPGLYVVHNSLGMTVLWRGEEFWSGRNPEWPDMARPDLPVGWILGPCVEDLLRDAARYRWLVRTDNISSAFYEDFAATALTTGNVIDAEIAREKED